jgi:hypothetical protein
LIGRHVRVACNAASSAMSEGTQQMFRIIRLASWCLALCVFVVPIGGANGQNTESPAIDRTIGPLHEYLDFLRNEAERSREALKQEREEISNALKMDHDTIDNALKMDHSTIETAASTFILLDGLSRHW